MLKEYRLIGNDLMDFRSMKLGLIKGTDIYNTHSQKLGTTKLFEVYDDRYTMVCYIRGSEVYDNHNERLTSLFDIKEKFEASTSDINLVALWYFFAR